MKKENIAWGVAAMVVITLVLAWWLEHEEARRLKESLQTKDDAIKKLEVNNLQLIQEILKGNKDLPDLVKTQLLELITAYEIKNPKIAIEIASIVKLIEANELEKGVMAIAKIIENILKDKLNKHEELKKIISKPNGGKRRAVFADYVDCANKIGIYDKAETLFVLGIKEYRNQEAHQVGVRRKKNLNISSMLTGIELIIKTDSYQLD